jgi:hypothetical protein
LTGSECTAYDAAGGGHTDTSSPLVGRLHPDPEIARQAAFALFAIVYLEAVALLPAGTLAPEALDRLPNVIHGIGAQNPHLQRFFGGGQHDASLGALDRAAARELIGWAAAQHVEREEPQIAYELGMLALGVALPPILVGALREIALVPESTVVELPDGSGYPTIFLATQHPEWPAAQRARLFVEGVDAEQLAGWAMLLLSRSLAPRPGSVVRVSAGDRGAFQDSPADVALIYNPVSWIGSAADAAHATLAMEVVVL